MKTLLCLIILLILKTVSAAQIGVNPPAVFIEPATRSGMMTLINKGSQTKEIEISFRFAYQAYDSSGSKFLVYDDSLYNSRYSLVPYVKAYPKKIRLTAGAESVVRFLLTGTSALADGTYWTRIIIRSSPAAGEPDTSGFEEGKLKAGFVLVTELVSILVYQEGAVYCGLDIVDATTGSDSARVNLDLGLTRSGNSPFWGNISVNVTDNSGTEVCSIKEILAIYLDTKKRFSFDRKLFKPGKYTAEILVDNRHKDLPADSRLNKVSYSKSFDFVIP